MIYTTGKDTVHTYNVCSSLVYSPLVNDIHLSLYSRMSAEISEFLSDPSNDDSKYFTNQIIVADFFILNLYIFSHFSHLLCIELIAVHCTHGLNRTGYLVCRYIHTCSSSVFNIDTYIHWSL